MRKKFLCILCTALVSVNLFCTPALATEPTYGYGYGISTQEIQQGINNELYALNKKHIRQAQTQASILYDLKYITELATWVDCLDELHTHEQNVTVLGYPPETINYQKNKLLDCVKQFNDSFSKDCDKYLGTTLDENGVAAGTLDYDTLIQNTRDYLTKIMDKWKSDYKTTDDIVKENKKCLKYMYYISTMPNKVSIRFNSMMPEQINEEGTGGGEPAFIYSKNSNLESLLTDSNYSELLLKGKELTEGDIDKISTGDIDQSKDLIELFLTDVKDTNGSITYSNVSNLWYLLYAGSSIYQPFKSKVGSDEYTSAIKNVLGSAENVEQSAITVYNNAIRYRKPLYHINLADDGTVTGEAKEITLADFITSIENEESGALVLPKGKLSKGKDDNSYMYYKGNDNLWKKGSKIDLNAEDEDIDESTKEEEIDTFGNASQSITDKSAISDPVFTYGKVGDDYSLGGFIMSNIIQDVADLDKYSPKTALLYMDVFGDIVLDDGTVILPGATNPCFIQKGGDYYPYTMAFMQSYPALSTTKTFTANCLNSEKKFVFRMHYNSDEIEDKDGAIAEIDGATLTQGNKRIVSVCPLTSNTSISMTKAYKANQFIQGNILNLGDDTETLVGCRSYTFKGTGIWGTIKNTLITKTDSMANVAYFYKYCDVGSDGTLMSLFTSDPSKLSSSQLGAVVKNYYIMCLSDSEDEFSEKPSSRFLKNLIGDAVIIEGLNGLTNVQGYVNFKQTSYDALVADSPERLKVIISGLLEDFAENLYSVKGVIGLEDVYQSKIFGLIISYSKALIFFIILILILIVIVKFMRKAFDAAQVIIFTALTITVCWIFVMWVPVYIPSAFNSLVDVLTMHTESDLGYLTLMMHMEDYDTVYNSKNQNNDISVNLYKFTDKQLKDISDASGVSMENILKGDRLTIDSNAGIFIEGNILKCSLDKLFVNNPIVGDYTAMGAGNYYTLKSTKEVSSMVDYYIPYHLIVDGLLDKLNGFNLAFPASREFINYGGLHKDSFVMRNYITSVPFLKPEDSVDLITEQYDPDIADACEAYLGDVNDTFGLKDTFNNKFIGDAQNTLWYKTFKQNGRLDDEEQLNAIIEKTTRNTKMFLINNYDRLNNMSDENIIKITALYMTVSLNRQMGIFSNELYPMDINISDFNLNDIYTASYVADRNKFRFKNLAILPYIIDNYSVITGSIFIANLFSGYLIISITAILVPLIYLAVCILLLLHFILSYDNHNIIRGTLRGCLLIFSGYFLHCLGLILSSSSISVFTIIIPLIVNIIVLDMIIRYLFTIFKNPLELGGKYDYSSLLPTVISSFVRSPNSRYHRPGFWNKNRRNPNVMNDINDYYSRYRDENGYDAYIGQNRVLPRILQEQRKENTQRVFEYYSKEEED